MMEGLGGGGGKVGVVGLRRGVQKEFKVEGVSLQGR